MSATAQTLNPTLGIIAGGGRLPVQLIEHCRTIGRPCFVIALEGYASPEALTSVPHATVRLGAVGEAVSQLKQHNVHELVLAGGVKRPSLASLRPDMLGAKLLARLGSAFFSGDDALLRIVIAFLEEEGFKVVGSQEVLAELAAPSGVLGTTVPSAQAQKDIARGMEVLQALGTLDIGQAIIVENGCVLGVEAAEGTQALIERCGKLRRNDCGGVLIKYQKTTQERRADLPTVGSDTVEQVHRAGLSGIAVGAGGSIILDQSTTVARANELGIFIVGVTHG